MFNTDSDYSNAIQDAQIYTPASQKRNNSKLIFINLILGGVLLFGAFKYFEHSKVTTLPVSKQAVLGVSETIDDAELSDSELINILNGTDNMAQENLANSMKMVTSEPSIKSKAFYTEEIARELDDRSGFRGKIAVVNNPNDKF